LGQSQTRRKTIRRLICPRSFVSFRATHPRHFTERLRYNDRGEVTSGKRHWDATTFAGGKQFEYNYDDIGNRLVARFGGDAAGDNLSESVYNPANALNQLTARTVPGEIWLTGEAPGTLSLEGVSEGGAFALEQQAGDRFFGLATVDNSAGPVQARIT
jgi:hypothetical protein